LARALFLCSPNPAAAAAIAGWLEAGETVAAIWIADAGHPGARHRDQRLALLAPRWSVRAQAGRACVKPDLVPRLSRWEDRLAAAAATGADVLISCYFPFVVPADLLAAFAGRAVNLHPAPLPRYRGPDPFGAMLADGSITRDGAMTLHEMVAQLDAGAIIARQSVAWPAGGTMTDFQLRCAAAGRRLTRQALPAFLAGTLASRPQDDTEASDARLEAGALAISSRLSVAAARLRCEAIAGARALPVADQPRLKVLGPVRVIGPITGQPPAIGRLAVELDLSDARVRLRRKRPWSSLIGKFHDLLSHLRAR